ncbi:MAG: hypothetical protein JWM84_1700, partial [Nocardioides sp.]|nr:hypothetical protein [Nocardioides sp.]
MDASSGNRREAAVVDWLIDRLAVTLADRAGGRHAPPWEPKQHVLLGVLEPIWVRPAPVAAGDDAADGEPDAEANAATPAEQTTAPTGEIPSLGLDFRVRTTGDGPITLEVDLAFALYLEEIATLEEQRRYLATDPTSAASEATSAAAAEAASMSATTVAGDGGAASAAPETKAEAAGETPAPPPRRRRERKARLLGAWRR